MRIAYVAAGAAGMYCGSCIHDNTVARTLLERGHDVTLIPTYTPLRTDEEDVSIDRVFYGAVNVYLQEKLALFRHTPRFLDRLLDGRRLLGQVGRFAGSTDAHDLGSMTLSVLRGESGHQAKELERLVGFLETLEPEVVHLPNSMFLGLAREVKSRLGVPVVCGLTGEDVFLDELPPRWREPVMEELARRAADADLFVATSRYFAQRMRGYLRVPEERVAVVPLGIHLPGFAARDGSRFAPDPFVVGYLARICPEKGLHLLLEAFHHLVERVGSTGRHRLRLEVAGYLGARDRAYFEEVRRTVESWGIADLVRFAGELDREDKAAFLEGLDVLSVPTTFAEPKGLFVLEALASGVPVVEPAHGSFPELVEATGGGVLVEPSSPEALAEALHELMVDRDRARRLGEVGRGAIEAEFDAGTMAERTLAVYRRVVEGGAGSGGAPGAPERVESGGGSIEAGREEATG